MTVAPPAVLTGTVKNYYTNLPLMNATVTVTDQAGTYTGTTSTNGNYTFSNLVEGPVTAVFELQGYTPQTINMSATAGQTLTYAIYLQPVPLAISVDSPTNGSTLNTPTIVVTGTVNTSAQVTVNGVAALVSGNTYTATIPLIEGPNPITASAKDIYNRTASTSISVNALWAPVISAVTSTNITGHTAVISWTTDQAASSTVEYGTTTAYGNIVTDPTFSTGHSSSLGDLIPGTTYHFRVSSVNSHNLSSSSSDGTFTTVGYPIITEIVVSNVTTTSATITWITDQPSDSLVSYGTTTAYGNTISDSAPVTSHSITITGLNMQAVYHFQVTSTNSYGLPLSSDDGTFTTGSPITITITSPLNGATIHRPDIMVKGTIDNITGNETGVTVNGVVATVYHNQFIANHVPLIEGANTITVNATDTSGYTATASITVTEVAGNYVTISSNIDSGIPTLETTLRVDGYASGTAPQISVVPGGVDWTNCSSADACKVKLTTEGIYEFTVAATGTDGNTYQDTIGVVVYSRAAMDALLQAKWQGMKTALNAGNIEAAVSYYAESSKNSFRQQFTILAAQLPQLVADMGLCRIVKVREHFAEYDLRTVKDGIEYSFQVLFMQDSDGVWRIRSF